MEKRKCLLCKKEIKQCELVFYHYRCLNIGTKKKYNNKTKICIEVEELQKPIVNFSCDKKDLIIEI